MNGQQQPLRRIALNGFLVEVWTPEHTRTRLADGAYVYSSPHTTEEYRSRARSLGYGEDVARLAREHDYFHALVAQSLAYGGRRPVSPTLHAVAHGQERTLPQWLADGEESIVLALARYVNTGHLDPWLASLAIAGWELPDLAERSRRVLDWTGMPGGTGEERR